MVGEGRKKALVGKVGSKRVGVMQVLNCNCRKLGPPDVPVVLSKVITHMHSTRSHHLVLAQVIVNSILTAVLSYETLFLMPCLRSLSFYACLPATGKQVGPAKHKSGVLPSSYIPAMGATEPYPLRDVGWRIVSPVPLKFGSSVRCRSMASSCIPQRCAQPRIMSCSSLSLLSYTQSQLGEIQAQIWKSLFS